MKKLAIILISLLTSIANANVIHTVNIITPHNKKTIVYIWLDIGKLTNGYCDTEMIIQPTVSMMLKTGDRVPVYGNEIRQLAGPGYTCATINFQRSEQPARHAFFILKNNSDNTDYIGSQPLESIVRVP